MQEATRHHIGQRCPLVFSDAVDLGLGPFLLIGLLVARDDKVCAIPAAQAEAPALLQQICLLRVLGFLVFFLTDLKGHALLNGAEDDPDRAVDLHHALAARE